MIHRFDEGKKTVERFEIEEAFKQLQWAVELANLKRLTDPVSCVKQAIESWRGFFGRTYVNDTDTAIIVLRWVEAHFDD